MEFADFLNELLPNHDRTSCSDEDSNGNEFPNEFGAPRCRRCAALHFAKHGEWPHGAVADIDLTIELILPKSMSYTHS